MTGRLGRFLRQNTIALLALFVGLSGTTFAATTTLGANTVGTKQLKKNAVTNVKIKNDAVTGAKVENNSITGADVLESSLGTVPSATAAGSATNSTNAINAINATNATNAISASNATGLTGPLAAGKTLTGEFSTAGHRAASGDFQDTGAITFAIPLPSAPTFNFIPIGGPATAQCPGSDTTPTAAAGQLCFYASIEVGATSMQAGPIGPTKYGSSFNAADISAPPVNYEMIGSWAVTSSGSASNRGRSGH